MKKLFFLLIVGFGLFSQMKILINTSEKNLAIEGYDPVAYFTLKKAIKGKSSFNVTYNGAVYYFSSDAHKKLFEKSPVRFIPQYGGWCAYGCSGTKESTGFIAGRFPVDPKTFKIINNKLYLFYNKDAYNALDKWEKHEEKQLIMNAENYWKSIEEAFNASK